MHLLKESSAKRYLIFSTKAAQAKAVISPLDEARGIRKKALIPEYYHPLVASVGDGNFKD